MTIHPIRRCIKHWQALPKRNRVGAALCVAVLIACIASLVRQIGGLVADIRNAAETPKPAAVHGSIQSKTLPLLEQADRQSALALDRHLASIHAFLHERKAGSKAFAEKMLSLQGKWNLVVAAIGDNSTHASFLKETFSENLFPIAELEKTVNIAVRGYLAELESIDDDLLVRLRADLADDALPRMTIPALRSEEAWRSHYHELSQRVAHDLHTDLAVIAGRELFLWQASNIATDLTLQAGAAVAARLGISSTILTAGTASAWETLGVGLIVAIVLDEVVNRLIKAAGYDAETQIAERVEQTLSDLGRTITDGDPAARATLNKLKTMQHRDPQPQIRAACAEAIRSIESGTQLHGLRRELSRIGAARAALRQETLRRILDVSQ